MIFCHPCEVILGEDGKRGRADFQGGSRRDRTAVDEKVELEVKPEASDVHVRRAQDGPPAVDEQKLRVKNPRLVLVNLDPRLQ